MGPDGLYNDADEQLVVTVSQCARKMAYTALVSAVLVCSVLCAAAVCPNNASIPCQRAPMPAVLLSQWWPGTGDNEAKIITRLRCRIACGTVAEVSYSNKSAACTVLVIEDL